MIRPSLSIYAVSGGAIFMDGARARDVVFSTGEHGSEQMQAVVPMTSKEAIRMLDRLGTPDVWLSAYGAIIWRGRLEDAQVVDEGLAVTAYGYWRNLSDVPYTALWSDRELSNWELVNSDNVANRMPERYVTDNDARLYGTLKKDTDYGNNSTVLEWSYEIPSGSSRDINAISFNYDLTLPSGWRGRIDTYTSAFGSGTTVNTFKSSASGSNETGSVDITFTAAERVNIVVFNNSGATYTNSSQDGVWFIKCTGIRVRTTTVASVYIDAIAADVLPSAAQLDTSTALIASNTMDINNAMFLDEYPADILTRLTALGDTSGNRWEVGVDTAKRLYYRRQGTNAREWFLNAESIQLQRSLSELRNSVYAVYKDENGRAVRGTASTNTTSTGRYSITRTAALDVDTTNSTQANYHRDVFLSDNKDLTPRAAFKVRSIYGVGTSPSPAFMVKAGDYVTVNNLPPSPDNALNKARRFRITRTEYDCESGELTIEPESPLPTLDFIIAREAAGVQRRRSERIRRH